MPGTVIGTSLNLGYAGKVSRNAGNVISARMVKSILDGNGVEQQPAVPFGFPVKLNTDNTFSKVGASGSGVAADTAATFAGIAVAEVKQMVTYGNISSAGDYQPTQACDVIELGSVTVVCQEGTPTAGGPVYMVTTVASSGGSAGTVVGSLIATSTPAGTGGAAVQLTCCAWTTGKVDANKIAELTLKTRNNP